MKKWREKNWLKKMITVIIAVVVLATIVLLLSSCGYEREVSPLLHEDAIIIAMIYTPSEHRTKITKTFNDDIVNPLVGHDINGNSGIKIGSIDGEAVQVTSTTIPAQYGVVFQCQHGTFTIQGAETWNGKVSKYKILYDKLYGHVHENVDVIYQEIYSVKYDNVDNKKIEIERKLVDLDFIDAQLKK